MRHSDLTFGRVNFSGRRVGMRFGNGTSVAGDTEAPTISTVVEVAQGYDPYLFVNRGLVLKATFSEPMDPLTGTGTRIAVNFGGTTKYCSFSSWSSTTEALYVYLLDGTEHDEDGLTVSSPIDLNGGTLKDVAGNNATLTFSPPSLSSFRVIWRGLQWGTDFTEGADAQKLYGVIRNTQISEETGVRGSGTGSDSNDPTWGADGAEFDGGDYFSSVPYDDILDFIDNPGVYSIYGMVYIPSTSSEMTIFTTVSQLTSWAGGGTEFTLYTGGYVTACNNHALSGTFIITPDTDWRTVGWHTCAWVSDGTTVKFYWDGVKDSHTFTGYGSTTIQTQLDRVRIGNGNFGVNNTPGSKMKFFAACNVAHTDAEVAAAHAAMGAM